MKKMLLVLCAVMLASLIASAQLVSPTTYDRTFYGFCNGEHMVLQKLASSGTGGTKVYVAGYNDLVDLCGFSTNAPTVGQKHAIGATVPPHELVGVGGAVLDLADDTYAATGGSGVQDEFIMDVTHNVWALYQSFIGFNGDYWTGVGTLTNGLPSKTGNAAGRPALGGSK